MTQPTDPQTIWISSGANEPTYWYRYTDRAGNNITTDPIAVSFGTDVTAATIGSGWVTGSPNLATQTGTTTSRDGTTLYWIEAQVLVGGSNFAVPTLGTYYAWVRLGSNPATAIIRRGPQITFE